MNGSFDSVKIQINHHLDFLNSLLDVHIKKYENNVFTGDFAVNTSDSSMKEFCSLNGLKILLTNRHATWTLKNQPALISYLKINLYYLKVALFLRLDSLTFIYSMTFQKRKPHSITYRTYKNFDNDVFRFEIQTFCFLNETDLGLFKESSFCIFNKHAPIRKTYHRTNEAPFMTKELHNAIMKRSRYRNKFLKGKS